MMVSEELDGIGSYMGGAVSGAYDLWGEFEDTESLLRWAFEEWLTGEYGAAMCAIPLADVIHGMVASSKALCPNADFLPSERHMQLLANLSEERNTTNSCKEAGG